MSTEFEGKVALITGATSGIGRATAIEFAAAGANVVAVGRRVQRGQELEEEAARLSGTLLFVQTDVTLASDVQRMVDTATHEFGGLDFAFNNAGGPGSSSSRNNRIHEYTEEDWDFFSDMYLKSVWRCMKHEIGAMLPAGRGVIVNNASVAGLRGFSTVPYTAMKHGVVGLTRAASSQYAGEGLRFNAICPGWVDTEVTAGMKDDPEWLDFFFSRQSVKRMGKATEVASLVKWLCSDGAAYVDGVAWAVDGGLTASI